ncbi:MAG: ParB N-terminal domain-containing protein [Chloroflexota bacterium]
MVVTTYDRRREMHAAAERLYDRSWSVGQIKATVAKITGSSRSLLCLADVEDEPVQIEKLEQQAIDIDRIRGTQGRSDRFDIDFHPVNRRSRPRWVSVATGITEDVLQMPPVEVVEVDGVYYVQDGQHRVSAAKALGKTTIDANVTRWHMDEA